MCLIFLDPGIRRDDKMRINQRHLKPVKPSSVILENAGIHKTCRHW